MTPSLRKLHRAIWFFLTAFLPLLFAAAILAIPGQPPNPPFPQYQPEQLPKLLRSAENDLLRAELRTDHTGQQLQIEIEVLVPLTTPSPLAFLAKEPGTTIEQSILIGGVSSRGIYRFDLTNSAYAQYSTIHIFDPVKNLLFTSLNLQ